MTKKTRRTFTPQEKVAILKQLLKEEPVSAPTARQIRKWL